MRKAQSQWFLAAWVAMAPTWLRAEEAPRPPERENKLRVLLVTGGHDFEHQPFLDLFAGPPDITAKEVVQPGAQQFFAPDKAGEYDVMVWYDMWGPIGEKERENLVALLNKGKPLVVLHHALIDYPAWPEAARIIGGRYYAEPSGARPASTYKHDEKFTVKIADPKHPITRFMKDFEIEDETYNLFEVLPDSHPILAAEHPTSGKVIGWTRTYGKSRVAYLQLGHDSKAYRNPNYRRLVAQAIRWTAGRLPEPSEEGFKPLFNGKNLEGWTVVGNPAGFEIRDGILRSESGKGGDWLRTNREFGDFILRVEWRVAKNGNAGVFVRSKKDGAPWETGSEVQISNEPRDIAHCTGSLYGTAAVDPRPDESPEVWHEFEIRCQGPRITVYADNLPVVEADANRIPALKAKPLTGHIGLQDSHNPTGWIEYRKVLIKELK